MCALRYVEQETTTERRTKTLSSWNNDNHLEVCHNAKAATTINMGWEWPIAGKKKTTTNNNKNQQLVDGNLT